MKHLKKFFEGYEDRDHTGTSNAVMSVAKMAYDISKKVLKLDREEVVNIITDVLDTYPELVFECVIGRTAEHSSSKKELSDGHPILNIYFYKPNWSTNGGYFFKSHFPDIDDLAEDMIGRFSDIGFYSKLYFDPNISSRFFAFVVSKYPIKDSNI